MRQLAFALFIALVFCSAALTTHAQENKTPEQKPAAPETTSDAEKPKNEVERMIADVTKRGDKVIGVCIDPVYCGDESGDQILNLEKGRAVDLRVPVYPAIARAAHASGTVVVKLLIDEEGKVMAAVAISGHPLLQAACVKAARESLFTPTTLDGEAVKVTGVIQYNFVAH
ncbi:MAG TPA: TonB family protein [Pyrinomonadaceae bacterium]|nr:TonB family protein [Pyrinomonadaceae bacterium]